MAVDARSVALRLEEFQVHDVASVLRRFIRGLDEPLLTDLLKPRWLQTSSESDCAVVSISCLSTHHQRTFVVRLLLSKLRT